MADMIGTAVVQETVGEILSNIKDKYKGRSNHKQHVERLEMAHIRLEAALEASVAWNITSMPLLRWQSKLKRAAQECDDMVHRCKKRIQEEEAMEEDGVRRSSSFPKRIARNARFFVSSIFKRGSSSSSSELSRSTVRRFEWFADGASEFLRFVEFGSPRQYMFLESLIRHLLAGKTIEYKAISGNQHQLFFLRSVSTPEGMEGRLLYVLKDGDTPENSFLFALLLQLSESTDIVGIAVRCLELLTPHFKSTADTVKAKLTQIPMHDLSWVPYADSRQKQHWNKSHTIFSKWFRPNPHCCRPAHDHRQNKQTAYAGNGDNTSSPLSRCSSYLEPVNKVYLLGHVPMSAGFSQNKGFPHMKLRLLFSPHTSWEGVPSSSVVGGPAMEMVRGKEHLDLYPNISFEQLNEIMLPKAMDCFRRNAGATEYQMLWKSKHGGAYIQVEECTPTRIFGKNREGQRQQEQEDEKVEGWTSAVTDFLSSWVAHAPTDLQSSIVDWINVETSSSSAGWWPVTSADML